MVLPVQKRLPEKHGHRLNAGNSFSGLRGKSK